MIKTLTILCIFTISSLSAQTNDSYYDYKFRDKLLYLHALINYDFNPVWYDFWERDRLSRNAVFLNFGSVETQDLQSILYININEYLAKELLFLYRGHLYESQITHTPQKYAYLGLEQSVYKTSSLFFMFNPAFNKEDIDLQVGFRFTDTARQCYVSFALIMEDFVYSEKNDRDGSDTYQPVAIHWLSRWRRNAFTVFTEGQFSTGFERTFANRGKSPDLTFHRQQINSAVAKLYFYLTPVRFFNLGFSHYQFHEGKRFVLNSGNFTFENAYQNYYLEFISPLRYGFHIRLVARYLDQYSQSRGLKHFNYHRDEIMPALFFEYHSHQNIWELGYMGSVFQWDTDSPCPDDMYAYHSVIEKVKFGWTFTFNETSRLQLSLSHVFSVWGFGGANIQLIHCF